MSLDLQALKLSAAAKFAKLHAAAQKKLREDKELKLAQQMQKTGTLNDKVSALMLHISKSFRPQTYCNLEALDSLLAMAHKKSRFHSQAALEALSELFTDQLLPHTPLRSFAQITEAAQVEQVYFESEVKRRYTQFVEVLQQHAQDSVEHHKKLAIRMLCELALKKEEQREQVLEAVVNKLGDSVTAVPTSVILECSSLMRRRRQLIPTVVKIVTRFMLRKNNSADALFYSVVLLNSVKLRPGEDESISLILRLYLQVFPQLVQQHSKKGNKVIALVLKHINKLYPLYADKQTLHSDFFAEEVHALYRLTHFKDNHNVQLQSLRFIFNVAKAAGFVSDRFYRSLYEFILPRLSFNSLSYDALTLLINTLFQALKEDHQLSRVRAFVKRILQVCLISEPQVILGLLLLVSELFVEQSSLYLLIKEKPYEDLEENYEDAPDSEDEQVEQKETEQTQPVQLYDPLKRDPQYSNSEYTGLFELKILEQHPHPTVRKWVGLLMQGERIVYDSDPILDYSLANFLDRITFRNPKTAKKAGKQVRRSLVEATANSKDFKLGAVREEEDYLLKYFSLKKEAADSEEELVPSSDESEVVIPSKRDRSSVFEDASLYFPN